MRSSQSYELNGRFDVDRAWHPEAAMATLSLLCFQFALLLLLLLLLLVAAGGSKSKSKSKILFVHQQEQRGLSAVSLRGGPFGWPNQQVDRTSAPRCSFGHHRSYGF